MANLDSLRAALGGVARAPEPVTVTSDLSGLRSAMQSTTDTSTLEDRIEQGLAAFDRAHAREEGGEARPTPPRPRPAPPPPPEAPTAPSMESIAAASVAEQLAARVKAQKRPEQMAQPNAPTQPIAAATPEFMVDNQSWMPGANTDGNLHDLKIVSLYLVGSSASPRIERHNSSMIK